MVYPERVQKWSRSTCRMSIFGSKSQSQGIMGETLCTLCVGGAIQLTDPEGAAMATNQTSIGINEMDDESVHPNAPMCGGRPHI